MDADDKIRRGRPARRVNDRRTPSGVRDMRVWKSMGGGAPRSNASASRIDCLAGRRYSRVQMRARAVGCMPAEWPCRA